MTVERDAAPPLSVPLFDPTRQVALLGPQLTSAFERVLRSGRYVLGEEVEEFETEMARYVGVSHAVGVASGTDALLLALKALDIGPGDRVVTTPFTFFATAGAILNAGATPVFADIDRKTFNLDLERVRSLLAGASPVHGRLGIRRDSIRALLPVHLYGQPAQAGALRQLAREQGLALVEDAAQALGAEEHRRKAGGVGDVGCFSFFPTKNLGGFGDGGLVVTDDDVLAGRVRQLRVHGAARRDRYELVGTNSRLDALHAALLRVKLDHLDDGIAARRAHAALYDRSFEDVEPLEIPRCAPHRTHSYHQYSLRVDGGHRDALRRFLEEQRIATAIYYPLALHLQPALAHLGYRPGDFPEAEKASRETLSIPVFPELAQHELTHVVSAVKAFFGQ